MRCQCLKGGWQVTFVLRISPSNAGSVEGYMYRLLCGNATVYAVIIIIIIIITFSHTRTGKTCKQ